MTRAYATMIPASLALFVLACTSGMVNGFESGTGGDTKGANAGAVGTDAGAEAFFAANVQPILINRCASCHMNTNAVDGPDFMGTAAAQVYASITANPGLVGSTPQASLLINKGAHAGPAFLPNEAQQVASFVTLFAQGAAASGAVGGGVLTGALKRFVDCMKIDDWRNKQVYQFADIQTGDGRCSSCHTPKYTNQQNNNDAAYLAPGTDGACMQENDDQMFRVNRRAECLTTMGVTLSGTNVVIANPPAWVAKQTEAAACTGAGCHPDYNLDQNMVQRLQEFLTLTKQRADNPAETCTPVN